MTDTKLTDGLTHLIDRSRFAELSTDGIYRNIIQHLRYDDIHPSDDTRKALKSLIRLGKGMTHRRMALIITAMVQPEVDGT